MYENIEENKTYPNPTTQRQPLLQFGIFSSSRLGTMYTYIVSCDYKQRAML